jgi:membrane protease YdiL (CAAX protease family)
MSLNGGKGLVTVLAWAFVLAVSDLPDILFKSLAGRIPAGMFWTKAGILVSGLALSLVWKKLRALAPFLFIFSVFFVFLGLTSRAGKTAWWIGRFGGPDVSFTRGYIGIYVLDTIVALAVIAALVIVKRRRPAFFLVKGDTAAPIRPVRWLGIREGESWKTFGWIFTLAASAAVAIPTFLAVHPNMAALGKAAALIPAVLLFAAVNAFNEEIYYRASMLSTLADVIGGNRALLAAALFFGLGHFLYGSPPGVVGFLMTAFFGWLIGKSMLETKGFLWPWFMHFVSDVVVFASYAVAWAGR